MKIVVIGLGSMGKRRIRLLQDISPEFEIIGVDKREDRRFQSENEFGIQTSDDLFNILSSFRPDCAVISTSPLSHAGLIEVCLKHGCHVFTELNLVKEKYEANIDLARMKQKVLFLSSTFLYRKEIDYLRQQVNECGEKFNYIYHVGQYLPDWHPWENVSDYFVGDKRTNGCREILAIELPWLIKTFGKIKSFNVMSGKNSTLPVEYDDNYLLLLEHVGGNKGMLSVDVISRKAVRNLEVYSENCHLFWDGSPDGLLLYNAEENRTEQIELYEKVLKQDGYASFIVENAYKNELESFIDTVNGKDLSRYTMSEDMEVLTLIDRIESGEEG